MDKSSINGRCSIAAFDYRTVVQPETYFGCALKGVISQSLRLNSLGKRVFLNKNCIEYVIWTKLSNATLPMMAILRLCKQVYHDIYWTSLYSNQ